MQNLMDPPAGRDKPVVDRAEFGVTAPLMPVSRRPPYCGLDPALALLDDLPGATTKRPSDHAFNQDRTCFWPASVRPDRRPTSR
jgi:hypothetical protein